MKCYSCHKDINVSEKLSFREECPFCRCDLHVCKQCQFYDEKAYNECRETSAERVLDKEKSNYCEYFQVDVEGLSSQNNLSEADLAKKKLEELFKKN